MAITNEMITLEANGKSTSAYVALPQGEGPWPGVVVIQEWWGLDNHIKSIADRFAEHGYIALAPDLYGGQVATEPDEARKLAMGLIWSEALAVIQSAVNYVLDLPECGSDKVGVTGFCMGGGLTWHAAAKLDGIGAAVPFYGGGPELTAEEVAQIDVPVLAIFGELDQGVSPEVARRRARMMDEAGIPHETIIYPDAHHAFFNDTRPIYDPEAAEDAWNRMLALFAESL